MNITIRSVSDKSNLLVRCNLKMELFASFEGDTSSSASCRVRAYNKVKLCAGVQHYLRSIESSSSLS